MTFAENRQRFLAGAGGGDLHVAFAADQFDDSFSLRLVVLNHQQRLVRPLDEPFDLGKRVGEAVFCNRFLNRGERAEFQTAADFVVSGDDVHRNVARRLVVFQAIEHRPPFHVRQGDIERDRVGTISFRQRNRRLPSRRRNSSETFVPRHLQVRRLAHGVDVGEPAFARRLLRGTSNRKGNRFGHPHHSVKSRLV